MGYLTTVDEVGPRPGSPNEHDSERERLLYVKSFLVMRLVVGAIGVALPTALILGHFWMQHGIEVRGSLSSYYHSGMRDVFVSALCATGVFLMAYKIAEKNLDNTVSFVAGLAAIGVAMFPTTRIKNEAGERLGELTPLQDNLGETVTASIHFGCALVSMVALAVMSWQFGKRERRRADQRAQHGKPHRRWDRLHFTCAGAILGALAMVGLSKATGIFSGHSLLVGEAITLYAFGVSWFSKGFELPVLSKKAPEPAPGRVPAAT
jgi:hypothetical protein